MSLYNRGSKLYVHLEGAHKIKFIIIKIQIAGTHPQSFLFRRPGAWEFAFLTSSQLMLMLWSGDPTWRITALHQPCEMNIISMYWWGQCPSDIDLRVFQMELMDTKTQFYKGQESSKLYTRVIKGNWCVRYDSPVFWNNLPLSSACFCHAMSGLLHQQ